MTEVTIAFDKVDVTVDPASAPTVEIAFDAAPEVTASIEAVTVDLSPVTVESEIVVSPVSVEIAVDSAPELTVEVVIGDGSGGGGDSAYKGWVVYANPAYSQSLNRQTRHQLTFGAIARTDSKLEATVDGHEFIAGDEFVPFPGNTGGKYRVRLNVEATAALINTDIRIELDIGGATGVLQTEWPNMVADAGTAQVLTATFDFYIDSDFLANGGEFYATPSNDVTLTNVSFLVTVEAVQ